MPHFKDETGRLHFLDNLEYVHLLPSDCVEISDEEAIALQQQSIVQVKESALASIDFVIKQRRISIAGTSDEAEIAGWGNKLRIAQAIIAGTADEAERAAFSIEVEARGIDGETSNDFVKKVIRNAGRFALCVGILDGVKRSKQAAVHAAASIDDVAAVLSSVDSDIDTMLNDLQRNGVGK